MKNFKKVLSICLMSTLIVSYASQYVGAVDDTSMESEVSSVVESDSGGMSEDNTETSTGTEQSEESEVQSEESTDEQDTSEKTEESSEEQVPEQSEESSEEQDTSEETEESSKEQVSEKSETEESSKQTSEIQYGKQAITISVDFNCGLAGNIKEQGIIDFSKVKLTLLSSDKSKVIQKLDLNKELSTAVMSSGAYFTVKVPEWGKEGVSYVLRAENLPSIYKTSTYDMPIVCKPHEHLSLCYHISHQGFGNIKRSYFIKCFLPKLWV